MTFSKGFDVLMWGLILESLFCPKSLRTAYLRYINFNQMKKLFFLLLLIPTLGFTQVGIGTNNPKGALDITSTSLSLVLPRVTSIETVTNGSSGTAIDATIVYDVSRNKTCFKIAAKWICLGDNGSGSPVLTDETPPQPLTIPSLSEKNKNREYNINLERILKQFQNLRTH